MNLFLYWPAWSGKSTVWKVLWEKLSIPQIDTDAVFVSNHGEIHSFVKEYGIDSFRKRESEILTRIIATQEKDWVVVSLWWWTLLRNENIKTINQVRGRIVTLMGSWDILFKRIESDIHNIRPLVQNHDNFMQLMESRMSHYQSFYPRISIDGKNPEEIAMNILWLYS